METSPISFSAERDNMSENPFFQEMRSRFQVELHNRYSSGLVLEAMGTDNTGNISTGESDRIGTVAADEAAKDLDQIFNNNKYKDLLKFNLPSDNEDGEYANEKAKMLTTYIVDDYFNEKFSSVDTPTAA